MKLEQFRETHNAITRTISDVTKDPELVEYLVTIALNELHHNAGQDDSEFAYEKRQLKDKFTEAIQKYSW